MSVTVMYMRKIIMLTTLLCIAFLATAQEEWIQAHVIRYDGQSGIFPPSWLGKKIRVKATPEDTAAFHSDTAALAVAWSKIPESILEKELDHVYLLGSLRFSGQLFTGTNSLRDIYIVGGDMEQTERTFHHEFSSILLRNYGNSTLEFAWKKLSPASLGVSSARAVSKGLYSVELDESLMQKGYLSDYSLSNWENDFNLYAEYLFSGGARFWQLADRFPLVKQKLALIIGFYHDKVWGGFSETFFRGLAGG